VKAVGGDLLSDREDFLHVPGGVVVGVNGLWEVAGGAVECEVSGGGVDRVTGVVGVGFAPGVCADAVLDPRCRHELHPPDRAGGGDVQVLSVVRLDGVDRGEYLPGDVVASGGGLVDGDQRGRWVVVVRERG
jgi:hypothetical protein